VPDRQLFVVRSSNGRYWCGKNAWDVQLRKALVFTSLQHAVNVVERYRDLEPKIYPITMTVSDEPADDDPRFRDLINTYKRKE